jgi:hypothetical protein
MKGASISRVCGMLGLVAALGMGASEREVESSDLTTDAKAVCEYQRSLCVPSSELLDTITALWKEAARCLDQTERLTEARRVLRLPETAPIAAIVP